jgi:hypothetical protein
MLHHKKNTFLETKKMKYLEEGELTTKSAASSVKTAEAAFFLKKI